MLGSKTHCAGVTSRTGSCGVGMHVNDACRPSGGCVILGRGMTDITCGRCRNVGQRFAESSRVGPVVASFTDTCRSRVHIRRSKERGCADMARFTRSRCGHVCRRFAAWCFAAERGVAIVTSLARTCRAGVYVSSSHPACISFGMAGIARCSCRYVGRCSGRHPLRLAGICTSVAS